LYLNYLLETSYITDYFLFSPQLAHQKEGEFGSTFWFWVFWKSGGLKLLL